MLLSVVLLSAAAVSAPVSADTLSVETSVTVSVTASVVGVLVSSALLQPASASEARRVAALRVGRRPAKARSDRGASAA
ncbi:MAG: hypothetical protein IPJ34_12560 [Myxococcales bacterium]|nr:hypothetical protein [Myxococcales bacterium]